MVFSSIVFISVFLPVVFCLHCILPDIRWKNAFLVLASLLFYAYGEPIYVLLMLASVLINYGFGRCVRRNGTESRNDAEIRNNSGSRLIVMLAIIVNIGSLGVFKYAGFLVGVVNDVFGAALPVPQIRLPIGISFFTFQALSYVIDVYRGNAKPQKNFGKVLLYISFFPQLIAGPIVKYHDIEKEIDNRHVTAESAALGMRRFAAGLSKKVLISNVLGQTVDILFAADAGNINVLTAWIAAVAYLLQIYFDFSGYSDMALGMGQMFGFHFKENFRYPYASGSVREFWRRWHMSLSGWFREYLYFPLGGNRKGRWRTVLNKFIVFFCTGLWHGANVTFVVWGLYHGFFLMLEEYFPKSKKKKHVLTVLGHLYALLVVTVGFVIFRADNMGQALFFIQQMFLGFHFEAAAVSLAVRQLTPLFLAVFAAGWVAAMPVRERFLHKKGYSATTWILSLAGLLLSIFSLSGGTYNPFIYFRF